MKTETLKIISVNTHKTRVQAVIDGQTKHLHKNGKGWTFSEFMTSGKRNQLAEENAITIAPLPAAMSLIVNSLINESSK